MTKLNQIVAVEKGLKTRVQNETTIVYHSLQKSALFTGLSRVYSPVNDGDETLPPESTRVQLTVEDQLAGAARHLTELFDVVATKENGNMWAKADVKVNGQVIVPGASVPLLLFLEKQLIDWRTTVSAVPVLDRAESWSEDDTVAGQYRTDPVMSIRTKKVPRNHVKAEATDRHPAQVEVYMEDIPVGRWTTIKFSGAVPTKRRVELVDRINVLLDAVKAAKEEANGYDIEQVKVGKAVFDYLLA
jgi:hypothetical protein